MSLQHLKHPSSNVSPVSSAAWTQRNWRWRKNENVNASNVPSVSCSVCSVRNPCKTLRERYLGQKHCATLPEDCGDDRHSKNTLLCCASTVQCRAYTVGYVKQRCSSSCAGQLAYAARKMCVGCSTVGRASALLIRRSLVRAQVGEPFKPCQCTVNAPQPTVFKTPCRCICRHIQLADADCVVQTLRKTFTCTQQRGETQD